MKISKILLGENQIYPNTPQERTIIDYDFTTTNPSSWLIGSGDTYGYTWASWSWIKTYNTSSDDKWGRAAKLIGEDLVWHIVTMDGTWNATIGDCWTTLWFWFWTITTTTSGWWKHLEVTLSLQTNGWSWYDDLKCPNITDWTWKKISGYWWGTVWNWTRTIRLKSVFDFINWTVTTEVYRNWTLLNTYDYTLTSAEQTTVRWYMGSNCYYRAIFSRWYSTANIWMKSWKIIVQ